MVEHGFADLRPARKPIERLAHDLAHVRLGQAHGARLELYGHEVAQLGVARRVHLDQLVVGQAAQARRQVVGVGAPGLRRDEGRALRYDRGGPVPW